MAEIPVPIAIRAPIRLCLLAANQRMRNTLGMLFSGPVRGQLILVDEGSADIAIIDLDNVGAEAEWKSYRERAPFKPILVLSVTPRTNEDRCIWVKKPFTIQQLLEGVAQAHQLLLAPAEQAPPLATGKATAATHETGAEDEEHTQPVPEIPAIPVPPENTDVAVGVTDARYESSMAAAPEPLPEQFDLSDPAVVESLSYDADGHLPMWLEKAIAHSLEHGAICLRVQDRTCLEVDATNNQCDVVVSLEELSELCSAPIEENRISFVSEMIEMPGAAQQRQRLSLDALRWRLALLTYRGRLPKGTPLQTRIHLRHWPNVTRLDETPNAMRIAALWVAHPMSLERIAEALVIPQRDVFAFYAGISAIRLVNVAKRASDQLVETAPPIKHPDRGFLRRVVRQLGLLVHKSL